MSERQKEASEPFFDGAQTLRDSNPGAMLAQDAPVDPEDAPTDLDPRRHPRGRRGPQVSGQSSQQILEDIVGELDPPEDDGEATRQMTASEAAEQVAKVRLSESVELSGEEAEAAFHLTAAARAEEEPSVPTAEVDPGELRRINLECRMCGSKVALPAPRRFGQPAGEGYRCHRCQNVFCAAHVVRVSGFFATLFTGARFSCQLCLPDNAPEAPPSEADTSSDQ